MSSYLQEYASIELNELTPGLLQAAVQDCMYRKCKDRFLCMNGKDISASNSMGKRQNSFDVSYLVE